MLSFLALFVHISEKCGQNVDKTTFSAGFLLRQRFIRRLQKIP